MQCQFLYYLVCCASADSCPIFTIAVAALQVSKNLPNIAQKTDIAPENVGAKANVRN